MKKLKENLDLLFEQLKIDKSEIEVLQQENAIFPFSIEGRILAYLLSSNKITFQQYMQIYNDYAMRNKYLYLFEMPPRPFGETWGENHILNLFPEFLKATKGNISHIYPNFDGEFDLWLNGIRVEVKSCRAANTDKKGSLVSRAYLHSEALSNNFKYHYQQLKPSCCDVFIWIGVCRDELIYWVITSDELQGTGKLGSQHRNENTGTDGVDIFEGQVFMTEEELHPFLVAENDILNVIRKKMKK